MTRRDGRDDNAYGITVDPKTKEYREYMDKVATLPEGKKPDDIILKIKELRIPTGTPFILGYTPEICKAKAKRDTLKDKTLYEKLANVCTVARCAYDAMTKNQTNRDSTIATALGYEKCQDMVTAKIYSEFEYMNTIINEAANRKLINGTNQYLTNYFARDRLINLQNKIGETYDAFAVVNRFVQE